MQLTTPTVIDLSPKALATALDAMVAATLDTDREVAAILATAREALRKLDWNRYAALQTARSKGRTMKRRYCQAAAR